mmetsp:Transcript_18655/g.37649  ORF Transcript_18655/g.37649 Transcript_18655/m.37649 type:complete len:81 (+) Transcript_18655:90-332(+)
MNDSMMDDDYWTVHVPTHHVAPDRREVAAPEVHGSYGINGSVFSEAFLVGWIIQQSTNQQQHRANPSLTADVGGVDDDEN